ncbi:hypothetical protein L914_01605, partial [Phytophthora nicotianae]
STSLSADHPRAPRTMRVGNIVLLATAILAAIDVTSGTSASTLTLTSERANAVSAFTNGSNDKRLLRTGATVNEGDEERAVAVAVLEKLKNARVQQMLREGFEVDDAFLALKLEAAKGNIFGGWKFKTWMKFANKLDRQNAGEAMVRSLATKYGDVGLAKMLRHINYGKTAGISKKLQRDQFDFWFKEGMGPRYVLRTLFKAEEEKEIGKLGRKILGEYRDYLNKNHPDWSKTIY